MKNANFGKRTIQVEERKLVANKKDVPYQSLIKVFLAEKVKEELF